MAKSTNPKKAKKVPEIPETVIEETKTGITVPVTEQIPDEETNIPEVGEVPESVTFDEVKEVEKVIPEPENVIIPDEDLSLEQKIINFIENKSGEIRMNDFLKSLFPVPKFNEPPLWTNKGENKRLRLVLEDLQKKGYITFVSNIHLKLGQFYHDGDSQQTKHHTIGTLNIVAKVN